MQHITTGQKIKFEDIGITSPFTLIAALKADMAVDVACFGLDATQKLVSDDYMTFYNQPVTPCHAVRWQIDHSQHQFEIDITKLPSNVDYLVLTATIDGAQTMRQLGKSHVRLEKNGQTVVDYAFDGTQFDDQRAIMLLQVYRKKGIWCVNAIGQGFNGGLAALVTHFGGEVAEDENHQDTTPAVPPPTKITLDKPGHQHRVNLDKKSDDTLLIEAIWIDNGDTQDDNDDLDLRVGILPQGSKTMTYVHADCMGSLTVAPYVLHHGDVRTASVDEPGKEVVSVNPAKLVQHFGGKVALVFSVYSAVTNGVVAIASLQPKMRMQYQNQVVECTFNLKASPKAAQETVYTYVIGIAILDEQGVTLQHSGETSKPSSEATPKLIWKGEDVVVKMNGPSMFKN